MNESRPLMLLIVDRAPEDGQADVRCISELPLTAQLQIIDGIAASLERRIAEALDAESGK